MLKRKLQRLRKYIKNHNTDVEAIHVKTLSNGSVRFVVRADKDLKTSEVNDLNRLAFPIELEFH